MNARSEREGGEVDVAAGKDDAEFGQSGVCAGRELESGDSARAEQGSYGNGAAGLDDDFHAFPDETHGGDDLFLGDQKDAIEMAAQDCERARGKGSTKTVGDGVAGIERLESAGGERAIGVIGFGRLAAEEVNVGTDGFGAEAAAAEKAAAADRSEEGVDVGDLFQKLFGGGGLAGDDAIVIVGMDEDGAGFGLNARGSFLARGDGRLGEGDATAVAFDGTALYLGGVPGHDDVCGNAAPRSGAGDGRAMIAAGGRDNPVNGFGVCERENRIGGAANFERAGFLEVVALEEELGAGDVVEGMRSENGSAMDARRDTGVGFANGFPSGRLIFRRFDLLRCAHGKP